MPSLDDFKRNLAKIEAEIRAKLPEVATLLTITAKALAERKIRDHGFGAVYSLNKIPAWFLEGKELNAAGGIFLKKVDKQKEDRGLTNWKEFRQAQGLQTEFVDLGYSNKMWAGMGPIGVENRGDIVFAPLGGTNAEVQQEMDYNQIRYGDFIGKALEAEDFNLLGGVVIDEFGHIIDNLQLT